MRLEFIGKTKTVIEDIDIQQMKMGQTDTVPAMAVAFKAKLPNTFLNVLDPSGALRTFCYEKDGNPNKKEQQPGLEGVEPVSDLPQLTQSAIKMGCQFGWEYEQTGCKTIIYQGIGRDASNIVLKDGTARKVHVKLLEGGTIELSHVFYVADLDAETIGEVAVLKKHDIEIELTCPEIISAQKELPADQEQQGPEDAMAAADKAALAKKVGKGNKVNTDVIWPFPKTGKGAAGNTLPKASC